MKLGMIGAGALGWYYGAQLARSGEYAFASSGLKRGGAGS